MRQFNIRKRGHNSTCQNFRQVRKEGNRNVSKYPLHVKVAKNIKNVKNI